MAREKKLIKLSDIKCEEIVEKIKESTGLIAKFTCVLNKHLDYKQLKEPQIFIVRSDCNAYKDDGNTKTPGYEYTVYWCFPYINVDEEIDVYRITYYESFMWPHTLLFFKLGLTERLEDHSYRGDQNFHLYVTEEPKKETSELRIAYYNDNYKLNSMLSAENLQLCTERINETYKRICLKQAFLKELCECEEIPDIEAYIAKNCKED